jgi:ribosomal protein L19
LRVPSSRKSTAASRKPLRCEGFYGVGVEKVFPVHSPHIAEIVTIRAAR